MFQNIILLIESYPSVIDGKTPSLFRRTQNYIIPLTQPIPRRWKQSYMTALLGDKETTGSLLILL